MEGLQVLRFDPMKVPAFYGRFPMFTIADSRDHLGLRAPQSHRMEQVAGKSDNMMVTTNFTISWQGTHT